MKNTCSLNKNTWFKRLYYKGKKVQSPFFTLYFMKVNNSLINRLGFTVSTKLGKAVVRNRVRRLLYESFKMYEPNLKVGYYMVISAKHSAVGADYANILRHMGGVLKKADLFNNEDIDCNGN